MLGSVTRQKTCQPLAPKTHGGQLFVRPDGLHHGNQLADHEREGHEGSRQDQSWHGENDLRSMPIQPETR